MNKTEKIICAILGAILAWYIWGEMGKAKSASSEATLSQGVLAETNEVAEAASALASVESAFAPSEKVSASLPEAPEQTFILENDEVKVELSSYGAAIKNVTLKKYATDCGEVSETNPAVSFDFGDAAIGRADVIEAFELADATENSVKFVSGAKTREIVLESGYKLVLKDSGIGGAMSIGSIPMGSSKNDLLSVDSWALDKGKGKPGVVHHGDDDSPLRPYLVGGLAGGCSGSKNAAGMPITSTIAYPGAQTYVALKNRFFVTALVSSSTANSGFEVEVKRDVNSSVYRPETIGARVKFAENGAARETVFYVGPKKQSILWNLGMKDVMEFGMWRWLCYPLVYILNIFHGWIPSFGIAIILLTILVRLIFWPLTHKSTVGMKKMQEIQPLMKEIQTKYKDNPQRLQQETWALYKEKQVNPMSSCLPMLIQIPIFIALFNVLRSAVELRYASFLWIADLSEPEALFASWFPFGGLNILPILMAVSTGLQSYFTPSTGDNQQQKMMMIFMPIMMLVMFYSFPAALSLYWFLSNLFSIVQMAIIRRQAKKA